MLDDKVNCMVEAKKFQKNYWDGARKFGYGGYKYIPGLLTPIAKSILKKYKLKRNSKILDVGCGKGFLLKEIKLLRPDLQLVGLDISSYAIKNGKINKDIKLSIFNAKKNLPFKKNYFDLVLCMGLIHNFKVYQAKKLLKELERVAKKKYLMTESYKDENELFNLQCWALTCETFFSPDEWLWLFKEAKYTGDYELIYFR